MNDLNKTLIRVDGSKGESLKDYKCISSAGDTKAYFKDLESHLLGHIQGAQIVVGCVAWLTNTAILDMLAQCRAISLVVQKEDFLRPDIETKSDFPKRLRQLYDALPSRLWRYD